MEYDITLSEADKILGLINPNRVAGFDHGGINRELGYKNSSPESNYILAALKRLVEDKLLDRYGTNDSLYQITATTLDFKAKGGYVALVKREKEKNDLKSLIEELGLKSAQSVIDTNLSIQKLNSNTEVFYTKQTGFNNWQKWLTIAILAAAAVQTIVATCTYVTPINSDKGIYIDTATHNQQLRQLENRIQSQTNKIESISKALKDSLKLR